VTVAPAHLRVAAGLVAVSLTIVCPGVAAVSADPGDSGRGHSRADKDSGRHHDGGDRSSSGHGRSGGGSDRHHRDHDRQGDHDGRREPDSGGRSDDVGSKGTDETEGIQVASRLVPSPVSSNSLVADPPPRAEAAEVPTAAAGGGGSGGAQRARSFVAPTVIFGDGRTPGFHGGGDELTIAAGPVPPPVNPAPAAVASAVMPPPAPAVLQPAPAVLPPTTILLESASPAPPEFIARIWAPLRPASLGGLAFGIAGLLIGPLAGVWLGYRQARAADAAGPALRSLSA
jgi:hypothetical protein